jgi:uncharacterized protein
VRDRISRRQAVGLLAGAAAASIGLYTWRIEPHWLELTNSSLPIRGLPQALEGRTLAQLSDLHIGPKVDDAYIIETFRRVRGHAPDIVAITGDWITYRGPRQFAQLQRVLEHMPHGKLGTVGILGNHDYGFEWRMAEVAAKVSAIGTKAGVTVLRNDSITLAGLRLIGLDDLWSPFFDPTTVMNRNNDGVPAIVLCHNPDAADRPVWSNYQGWILAGHTHGGQCKPPFLPPPLLPVKNRRYTSGEFALSGNRRVYISRGVGHLLRVRFNVRPEVAVFTLARET